jgi:hypothetical protein
MPDDHSKLVPLLPIPNRTVKRLSADDSADSRVKVGHRQALTVRNAQLIFNQLGVFFCGISFLMSLWKGYPFSSPGFDSCRLKSRPYSNEIKHLAVVFVETCNGTICR